MLVLGASGATGRLLVCDASRRGHNVRALARDPSKLNGRRERVSVVTGDVLDPVAVDAAVAGQDAVVWAISARGAGSRRTRRDLCSRGTANVLASMHVRRVRRLLAISSWGVGESRRRVPPFFRYLVLPLALGGELADKERQEALIRRSELEWTIIRPSRLSKRPRTGAYQATHSLRFSARSSIARADLVDFLLAELSDGSFVHSTVEVTSGRSR